MKQTLQNLVAEGKTKQVLEKLKELTQSKAGLQKELTLINARFTELEKRRFLILKRADPSVLSAIKSKRRYLKLPN